jgi:hypothetical protein
MKLSKDLEGNGLMNYLLYGALILVAGFGLMMWRKLQE